MGDLVVVFYVFKKNDIQVAVPTIVRYSQKKLSTVVFQLNINPYQQIKESLFRFQLSNGNVFITASTRVGFSIEFVARKYTILLVNKIRC